MQQYLFGFILLFSFSLNSFLHSSVIRLSRNFCTPSPFKRYVPPFQPQRVAYEKSLLKKQWRGVALKYIEQFKQEQKHLEESLYERFGWTESDIDDFKFYDSHPTFCNHTQRLSTITQTLNAPHQPIPAHVTTTIHQVLNQHNIDPQSVPIVPDTNIEIIGVDGISLHLNPHAFRPSIQHPFKKQMRMKYLPAVMCHEVQHLLHDDAFNRFFYTQIPPRHPNAIELISKLSILQEKRADIMAGLQSPTQALMLSRYYHQLAHPMDRLYFFSKRYSKEDILKLKRDGEHHPLARAVYLETLS